MKKLVSIIVLGFLTLSFGAFAQIKVASNGYVGINHAAPIYNLDWFGTGRFSALSGGGLVFDNTGYGNVATIHPLDDWMGCLGTSTKKFNVIYSDNVYSNIWTTSDETVKKNIQTLTSSLDKIMKLRGVSYDLNSDYYHVTDSKIKAKLEEEGKNKMGFLAQELKEVFPDAVRRDSITNLYAVNYIEIIPVLVEAIKEQQIQIDELKAMVTSIEENCCKNNLKSASLGTEVPNSNIPSNAKLDQNIPNPFSKETKIGCSIPDGSTSSVLYIYNMQGTQLQQYNMNGTGKQEITINGNSFIPGMYLYSLIIDGKEIDTKRMILTK